MRNMPELSNSKARNRLEAHQREDLRERTLKNVKEDAREDIQEGIEPPPDTMETIPIIVKRSSTVIDAPSLAERLRKKSVPAKVAKAAVTSGFNLWHKAASLVARWIGWTPRVAPYVGYGTTQYVRLICRTVLGMRHLAPTGTVSLGIRNMLMIPAPHIRVKAKIDDTPILTAQIGSSEAFEPVGGTDELSSRSIFSDSQGYLDLIAKRELTPGEHEVTYKVAGRKPVKAPVYVFPSTTRVGIISDVDDTILVSQVPTLLKAVYNFLFLNPYERSSVPGMAVLYSKINDLFPDAPFFYLSTSPWNVETTIRNFIDRYGFPQGPLLLRDLDPRPKKFTPTGIQHKLEFVEQLMSDFPHMKFILFGDDGQKDTSTYARLTYMYPGRIIAIGIRQISRQEASIQQKLSRSIPDVRSAEVPMFYGPTGTSLMRSMLPYLKAYANQEEELKVQD